MANVTVDFIVRIADIEREVSTVRGHQVLDDGLLISDLVTARDTFCTDVAATTNGVVQGCQVLINNYESFDLPTVVAGEFNNSEDKAFLVFREPTGGGKFTMQIPAPKKADFLTSDFETVDPTSGQVATLITLVEGFMATKDGNAGLKYTIGYRRRSRSRRENPGVSKAIG